MLITGSKLSIPADVFRSEKLPQDKHRWISRTSVSGATQTQFLEQIFLLSGCGLPAQRWLKFRDLAILLETNDNYCQSDGWPR